MENQELRRRLGLDALKVEEESEPQVSLCRGGGRFSLLLGRTCRELPCCERWRRVGRSNPRAESTGAEAGSLWRGIPGVLKALLSSKWRLSHRLNGYQV